MRRFEWRSRGAQCQPCDLVTNRGSSRVTNRVIGARRVTHGTRSKGKKGRVKGEKTVKYLSRDAAAEKFFRAGQGMKLVTVSVEV